tara:strand:- start:688 stop:1188 length:501 start_codon:yes stop_codon:yes gene_type:complete
MYTAQKGLKHPIAIRYPRGRGVTPDWKSEFESIEIGTGVQLKQGDGLAILSVGAISNTVSEAIDGLNCAHYDMRFVKPLDEPLLHTIFKTHSTLITIEDGVMSGGFGSAVLEFAATHNYKNDVIVKGIPNAFIEHGAVNTLYETLELDSTHLKRFISDLIQKKGTP